MTPAVGGGQNILIHLPQPARKKIRFFRGATKWVRARKGMWCIRMSAAHRKFRTHKKTSAFRGTTVIFVCTPCSFERLPTSVLLWKVGISLHAAIRVPIDSDASDRCCQMSPEKYTCIPKWSWIFSILLRFHVQGTLFCTNITWLKKYSVRERPCI